MRGARNLHATAVAFGPRRGALILGPSGAGKSRLGLALIERGAQLIADDQVFVTACDGALFARAPRPTAGLIEARGLGLLRVPHRRLAQVVLVLDLTAPPANRLPDVQTRDICGVTLRCLAAHASTSFAGAVTHYLMGRAAPGATG